jgi:excinuclease UvrABC nuclease subunit
MIIQTLGNKREYLNIHDYKRIPKKCGVYVLIYVENGKPKAFTRLNGTDYEGILLIGKAVDLRRRVREFYKDILSEGLKEKYHSEGWNFRAYFRDNPNPQAMKLKPENIWVYWTLTESEKQAYQFETQLKQDYVTNFQDKPPLNINIKRQRKR